MKVAKNAIGVGFLLFCWIDGFLKLYTIREIKSKPEISKKAGMISFPIETFDSKLDGSEEDTIRRLIKEEIGFPLEQIKNFGIAPKSFSLIPGREDIKTIYGYGLLEGKPEQVKRQSDDDIVFSGWWTIQELLCFPKIRVETRPIMEDFLLNGRIKDLYIA